MEGNFHRTLHLLSKELHRVGLLAPLHFSLFIIDSRCNGATRQAAYNVRKANS
jgi:hypothetical protein